jgi:hypothetical protein
MAILHATCLFHFNFLSTVRGHCHILTSIKSHTLFYNRQCFQLMNNIFIFRYKANPAVWIKSSEPFLDRFFLAFPSCHTHGHTRVCGIQVVNHTSSDAGSAPRTEREYLCFSVIVWFLERLTGAWMTRVFSVATHSQSVTDLCIHLRFIIAALLTTWTTSIECTEDQWSVNVKEREIIQLWLIRNLLFSHWPGGYEAGSVII